MIRFYTATICISAILGTLWPTSFGGAISSFSSLFGILFCSTGTFFIAILTKKITKNIIFSLIILFLLCLFTLFSTLPIVNFGAIAPYVAVSFLLALDLRLLRGSIIIHTFLVLNILLVLLSIGIILNLGYIIDFIGSNYQQYYDELFEQTVIWYLKPVTVYGTHSVAAFVYFCFSSINFYLYKNESSSLMRKLFLMFALIFLLVIPFLKSVSAVLIFVILLLIYSYFFVKSKLFLFVFCVATLLSSLTYSYLKNPYVINNTIDLTHQALTILSSDTNGFKGRYLANSRLSGTLDYLADHPLKGVGFTSSHNIHFGDSFVSEYVLRLGIFGYLIILVSLFMFLHKNISDRKLIIPVFIFFLVGDLGFPLLVTFKFIVLIPLFILVINSSFNTKINYERN